MALPATLSVALKEWAIVCSAVETGRQLLLLRKGGIYESAGEFEVEHRHFLLFPTYLHQNATMLKADQAAHVQPASAEPNEIRLSAAAAVTDIVQVASRAQVEAIDDEHVWTSSLIDMRFNYRPENPLYLLLVRAYRLSNPVMVENTPAYAGCKSWVPLEKETATAGAFPVLDDARYELRRRSILDRIAIPLSP